MKAKKRPSPDSPAKSAPPTATEVDVIIAEKGGFGTRLQASPNPHMTILILENQDVHTHIPEPIVQVVYE